MAKDHGVQYTTVRLYDCWRVGLKHNGTVGWLTVDTRQEAFDLLVHWFAWMRGDHE
ncbi:hypothetical protein UFOVP903_15 [uncultured Caudovirales phage]|uniref:Uncharacterized protein n=1 Tax=uncultured Caudovirales phage TaxID=2100421 RepID=A0A6J5S9V4_9CAUD|nr:hypothetical protein UFOVP903_15 [uncultured Caudovirales phage]CAB4197690.1 hypothetical protein UFOVP1318_31 [uncultured Caudovirales phage]CAB4210406.1 hypothetical protein UFOVP1430_13 [uncultured Caudovirales phage]